MKDRKFKRTVIILKMNVKREQYAHRIGSFSRAGNCEKESNKNVRNGNTVMEMKNAFDGLISMLATAVVRTIVLECRSTEITQNETQRGKAV